MDIRTTPLEADCVYHIYNRGVNGESIFTSKDNYLYFLEKIKKYLLGVCDVYSYCLLPNHFHLLLKVKDETTLKNLVKVSNLDKVESGLHSSNQIFSKQFSLVFNSYSQAFNKQKGRHGPLIESPFKRKKITDDEYLLRTVIYIHQNPQLHQIVKDFRNYPFSSYSSFFSTAYSNVERQSVLSLFGGTDVFEKAHKIILDEDYFE